VLEFVLVRRWLPNFWVETAMICAIGFAADSTCLQEERQELPDE
jgi:hypothetical protein